MFTWIFNTGPHHLIDKSNGSKSDKDKVYLEGRGRGNPEAAVAGAEAAESKSGCAAGFALLNLPKG